jgi:hypothetical protein
METRILGTGIWTDPKFRELDDKEARITLFLLSNDRIPTLPCYQIGLDEVAFYCGTTVQKVTETIPKLTYFGIYYKFGYFILSNKFTRARYTGGKTEESRKRLWESYPEQIREFVDIEGCIDQRLGNDCPTVGSINHKSEIINHKSEIKNTELAEKVLKWFNKAMDTNFKSYYGFKDNLDFWSKVYSEEDIKKALLVLRSGAWWAKDPTPTLLFRRKSPKGEPVDYIGELLNLKGGENT